MVTPSWAWTTALGWVFSQHSPGWVWVHSVTLKGLGQERGSDPPLGRVLSGPLCRDARFYLAPNQNANLNWNSGP